jgi:sarcosine oxidase / L-pipecolate oxidase
MLLQVARRVIPKFSNMSTHSSNYIIIGAGAFGASTALHLSRREPSASIVLIDRSPFPCPIAASNDINKIVRADYADLFYCRLGLKALDVWRNDPLFKPYYHQSGMLSVYTIKSQQVKRMLENFRTCGVNDEAEIITPADMKRRFGGVYADATFYGHEEILWNPNSGWAEADKALKHTIEAAVAGGVQYISASVSKLILEDGSCAGVETDGGDRYIGTKTILCTGAGTAKLLADSAPKQMALQVNGRIIAGGISSASVNLSAQQIEKYKDTPALLIETDKLEGSVF